MRAALLLLAAGQGTRAGSETPKQYVPIAGTCALRRALDTALDSGLFETVQVVIADGSNARYEDAIRGLALPAPVIGGATRTQSVRRGLDALGADAPDTVLIHDAARPFMPRSVFAAVLAALETGPAAAAALPLVDALWKVEGGAVVAPVSRDGLWRAQTPQGFRFAELTRAYATHPGEAADDVAVARAAGLEVTLVPGAPEGFKITRPEDFDRAERLAGAG